jgi:hypothetical protein
MKTLILKRFDTHNYIFVIYKTLKFKLFTFDRDSVYLWWIDIGPFALIKKDKHSVFS